MAVPTVWLRQGSVPSQWLSHETASAPAKARRPSPTGLVLFGGPAFVKVRDAVALACGNVTDCTGKNFRPAISVGAAYWLTRFLAAEATFVQPRSITVDGAAPGFRFTDEMSFHLVNVVAKVGVPLGPVRFYGNAGANYHRGTFTSTETIDPVTLTVDDTTQTIAGGTQTSSRDTAGWGWLFGGGLEGWITPSIGLFGEVNYARLKGTVINSTEGGIDDRVTLIAFGLRVHLGRH
jgi:opacity protein-like surface antigen